MRMLMLEIRMPEVLTLDTITAGVNAAIYYKIFNPALSILQIKSVDFSTKLVSAAVLRNIFSVHTFQQIQTNKDNISRLAKEALDVKLVNYGVCIERIEMYLAKIFTEI
jgi:regulator of protease activity HflC (stomatin/prohibitin superfamily)